MGVFTDRLAADMKARPKTINGRTPDAAGNIEIPTGSLPSGIATTATYEPVAGQVIHDGSTTTGWAANTGTTPAVATIRGSTCVGIQMWVDVPTRAAWVNPAAPVPVTGPHAMLDFAFTKGT